eukprot:NODE_79_length_1712_cov_510.066246_g78_i0.p1 GENE.NODE_79_length_1712_cov_510.066246_g78_i0~~NODE_79_length_1712_cov_510.066246_g78_i0.p1  ORF type:complete len:428 (-),score=72.22 NODE_79_length_1712_cov_510.066246_g78_i0:349-1632(-)
MFRRTVRLSITTFKPIGGANCLLAAGGQPCQMMEPIPDFVINVCPFLYIWWKMKYFGDPPRQSDTFARSFDGPTPYPRGSHRHFHTVEHTASPSALLLHNQKTAPPHPFLSKYKWKPEYAPTEAQNKELPKVVTIFGGSGFLGTRIVNRLLQEPWVEKINIGTRFPEEHTEKLPEEWKGKVEYMFVDISDRNNVLAASVGANAVINLMGGRHDIEFGLYEASVVAADHVAHACKVNWVARLIQISSVCSAHETPSEYGYAKFRGEEVAIANFPNTTIFRSAPMFGKGCADVKRWKRWAMLMPFYPVFGADVKFNPVWVDDVANGMVEALRQPHTRSYTIDAVGPQEMTHMELIRRMQKLTHRWRPRVPMPIGVGVYLGWFWSWVTRPFFTHDMFNTLMYHDLVASKKVNTLENLGIKPRSLEQGWNE